MDPSKDLGRSCWILEGSNQMDPEVFFGPSDFLEAWGAKAKTPHMFMKLMVLWPCRLRRQGQQTMIFLQMCGFWP
jgi:hypothetical protein